MFLRSCSWSWYAHMPWCTCGVRRLQESILSLCMWVPGRGGGELRSSCNGKSQFSPSVCQSRGELKFSRGGRLFYLGVTLFFEAKSPNIPQDCLQLNLLD